MDNTIESEYHTDFLPINEKIIRIIRSWEKVSLGQYGVTHPGWNWLKFRSEWDLSGGSRFKTRLDISIWSWKFKNPIFEKKYISSSVSLSDRAAYDYEFECCSNVSPSKYTSVSKSMTMTEYKYECECELECKSHSEYKNENEWVCVRIWGRVWRKKQWRNIRERVPIKKRLTGKKRAVFSTK